MDEEGGEVQEAGGYLGEGSGVVLGEFDAFPEFGGHVGALEGEGLGLVDGEERGGLGVAG